uniref:Uncharacterized protein n=1 Tax=Sparus aurata TaxID=8175 RepID=A0A671V4L3_SPAAU
NNILERKTILINRLIQILPHCCVAHQDDFFKLQDQVEVGEVCLCLIHNLSTSQRA